jgi:hypothetical protein
LSDRDWEKVLAKIDKQLGSLSDEQLLGPTPVQLPGGKNLPAAKPAKPAKPSKAAAAPMMDTGEPTPTKAWAVYARLTISVALGVAMILWPYPARCGPGLAGYLAAVAVVVGSGIWSAVWTWRHRAPKAHSLSLLLIMWGLVLGSMEVLPRVGYAKPDLRHPAEWACPSTPK